MLILSIINICRSFLYLAADDAYPIGDPMNAKMLLCPQPSSSAANAFPRESAWQRKKYYQTVSAPLSSLSVRPSAAVVEEVYSVSISVLLPAQSVKTNWVRKLSHVLGSQHIRKLPYTASDHEFLSVDESEGDIGDSVGSDGETDVMVLQCWPSTFQSQFCLTWQCRSWKGRSPAENSAVWEETCQEPGWERSEGRVLWPYSYRLKISIMSDWVITL